MKRTLMRTLSLVLALVLAVGLLTVGAGAAFKDDGDISYKEAVGLLSGLGVINGYEDGSFRPTGNFDRAGLAKMVAYFCWGGADKSAYYANANVFADLAGYNWAAGSINYGYNAGYISGAGVNKDNKLIYNPAGTVKGSELAKTLLVVLGYKADAKDAAYALVGSNWELNSIRLAETEGLFANLKADFDPTAALTREQAAQMFYNLLGKTYTYTEYNEDGTPVKAANSLDAKPMTKYFKEWTPVADSEEAFGRPNTGYKKGDKTVTVASAATLTYTGEVTTGKIFKDLGKVAVAEGDVTVKVNGADGTAKAIAADGTDKFGTAGDAEACTVEVYLDKSGSDPAATIVVISTKYDEVTKVTPAKGDKAASITVNGKDFETTGYAKGDKVLYTATSAAIQSVQKAPSVEGKVSATKGDKVTIDGKVYTNKTGADLAIGAEGTFYLNIDNSIAGFVGISGASEDWGFVYSLVENKGSVSADGLTGNGTYTAYMVKADGTKASYVLDKTVDTADGALKVEGFKGAVVSYRITANGTLALAEAKKTASAALTTGSGNTIGKEVPVMGTAYANASTVFVFTNVDKDTQTVTTKVITGYKNVANQEVAATVIYNKENNTALTVFVGAKPADEVSAEKLAVLLDKVATVTKDGEQAQYTYTVWVNGKETTLTFKEELAKATEVGDVFSYTVSGNYATEVAKKTLDEGKVVAVPGDYAMVGAKADGADPEAMYSIENVEIYLVTENENGTIELSSTTLAKDDVIAFATVSGGAQDGYLSFVLVTRAAD